MPDAARTGDEHTCPEHGAGLIGDGALTVRIGFSPAARVDDLCICPDETATPIAEGAFTVNIELQNAARVGDPTATGGVVSTGCPVVRIGTSPMIMTMLRAAALGLPFVAGAVDILTGNEDPS